MKKITRQKQQQKTMQKIYQSSGFYDKNALRKLKKSRFQLLIRTGVCRRIQTFTPDMKSDVIHNLKKGQTKTD